MFCIAGKDTTLPPYQYQGSGEQQLFGRILHPKRTLRERISHKGTAAAVYNPALAQ